MICAINESQDENLKYFSWKDYKIVVKTNKTRISLGKFPFLILFQQLLI